MNSNHSMNIAEQTIHRLIECLLRLFNLGRASNEEVTKLNARLQSLDDNNPDYAEVHEDRRENMKLYWRLMIMLLSIGVDFLLSFQAMEIICSEYNLPSVLKYLVPAFLIIVEIGISYFQILNQRNGEQGSWFVRNAQYLVLLILAGFTTLVIIYSIQSYNASTDGMSLTSFIIGTLLWQIALFVASLMLHIWLIRNAEAIAETFAHILYKIDRNKLARKIRKLEKDIQKKYKHPFVYNTYKLVQKTETFRKQYPQSGVDFARTMPIDLSKAINNVMGKTVFVAESAEVV